MDASHSLGPASSTPLNGEEVMTLLDIALQLHKIYGLQHFRISVSENLNLHFLFLQDMHIEEKFSKVRSGCWVSLNLVRLG